MKNKYNFKLKSPTNSQFSSLGLNNILKVCSEVHILKPDLLNPQRTWQNICFYSLFINIQLIQKLLSKIQKGVNKIKPKRLIWL